MASRVKELADEEAARAEAEAPGDDDDTDEAEAEAEAEAEDQTPADQPAEAQAPSTADVEKAQKAIDRLRADNERRLRKIMGADFETLIPSPLDDVPGYCFPIPPEQRDPAQIAAVRELIEPSMPPLRTLAGARPCPDCDGYGQVLTTSKREGNMVETCVPCSGRGWVQAMPITTPPPSGALSHANVPQNGTEALPATPPRPEPYYNPATGRWELP